MAQEAARHEVKAAATVSGGVVRGNRLLLAQLVGNLVANAVAYNVPDGTVDVGVESGRR